jgi:uncharacterized protein (DUF2126 family)
MRRSTAHPTRLGERSGALLSMPIVFEGCEPPSTRAQRMPPAPRPGRRQAQDPPRRAWDRAVSDTHILVEEAGLARLGTEKLKAFFELRFPH